jgi:hypothetical protein
MYLGKLEFYSKKEFRIQLRNGTDEIVKLGIGKIYKNEGILILRKDKNNICMKWEGDTNNYIFQFKVFRGRIVNMEDRDVNYASPEINEVIIPKVIEVDNYDYIKWKG